MTDYSTLIRLDSAELTRALRRLAPPHAPGQWIFALLDIARTDYYPVNQDRRISLTARLAFASRLLDFVTRELRPRDAALVAREYLKVARHAIESAAQEVPPALQTDAVVARALECFALTREQAMSVATERRFRYADALSSDLSEADFNSAVRTQGDKELSAITHLLQELQWFQGKATDKAIADKLKSWIEIYPRLTLGREMTTQLNTRQKRLRGDLP
ncbi:hypothetical protein AB0K94_19565 [Streptomyces sp. NPDC053794]